MLINLSLLWNLTDSYNLKSFSSTTKGYFIRNQKKKVKTYSLTGFLEVRLLLGWILRKWFEFFFFWEIPKYYLCEKSKILWKVSLTVEYSKVSSIPKVYCFKKKVCWTRLWKICMSTNIILRESKIFEP